MKQAFLFLPGLFLSLLTFAQTSPNGNSEDHIKIVAANDSLIVHFKNKSFKLNKIQELDSCLKNNLPEMTLPVVDLEVNTDLSSQNHRALIIITDKYRLPVVSERTFSSGNGKLAGSVRRDAYDH